MNSNNAATRSLAFKPLVICPYTLPSPRMSSAWSCRIRNYFAHQENNFIPVIAYGDVTTPEKSLEVLCLTNNGGLMIGRDAQGRLWIFRELNHLLKSNAPIAPLEKKELRDMMLGHLNELHQFCGDETDVRVARRHLTWYCSSLANSDEFRRQAVRVDSASEQLRLTKEYFDREDGGVSLAA